MGRRVCTSLCPVPQYKSRTERPSKPKFGRMNLFRGQKVKVTRPINAETGSARHIFWTWRRSNFKLRTHREARRPASATSAVTSKVDGQGRKVTWCVWQVLADISRERKRHRNTKIGRNYRKVVHPTGNNAHKFQGQRQRSRSPYRHDRKCVISSEQKGLRT